LACIACELDNCNTCIIDGGLATCTACVDNSWLYDGVCTQECPTDTGRNNATWTCDTCGLDELTSLTTNECVSCDSITGFDNCNRCYYGTIDNTAKCTGCIEGFKADET